MAQQANQVLMRDDIRVGADLAAWLACGGAEGLARALREPEQIIPEIAQADLRGMGGAGFPTHRKWAPVAAAAGDKYVICNGNEDEPGTFKDRYLLEHTPHQVIEGALIAAVATRANHVVLYVNPHLELAIAEKYDPVHGTLLGGKTLSQPSTLWTAFERRLCRRKPFLGGGFGRGRSPLRGRL